MTMRQFLSEHRGEIDEAITHARDFVPRTASCFCHRSGTDHRHTDSDGQAARVTDTERREWVLNDEGLYQWARWEGVSI